MAPRRNNTNHHHHSHHPTPQPPSSSSSHSIDVQSILELNDLTTNSTNTDHQNNNNLTVLSLTSNSNTLTSSSISTINNIINFDIQNLQNNMTSSTSINNNNNNNTTHNNNNNNNTNNNNHQHQNQLSALHNLNENYTKCCVPIGECFKLNISPDYGLIGLDDLSDCIRVLCNNENCTTGQYMHRECFESWEQSVLTSLKSIGRARSWSDRQRQQNLWTKKGYDLVYKACSCKCGRGHLKKDLDWQPPPSPTSLSSSLNNNNNNIYGRSDDDSTKKKKKRNRNNQKPTLAITSINPNGYHPNSGSGKQQLTSNNVNCNTNNNNNNNGGSIGNNGSVMIEQLRGRAGSLSSSNGSTSPPVSASSEHSISPIHNGNLLIGGNKKTQQQLQIQQQISSPQQEQLQQTIYQQQFQLQHQQLQQHQQQQQNHQIINAQQLQKTKVEIYSERVRSTSGCNGIFSRRIDFSTFNQLPKTRLNSYQVKMEDEGNHGNDETRLFILSSLAQNQKSRVNCILCEDAMLVFDRYPLVDGSFFLSPKQYSPGCIEVKYEGRIHYLTAVCMGCLDGNSCSRGICCRFCGERWDGSSLVLGTMYSYDIFAAMPCCAERLKCNACFKLLLPPEQRLNFYSDYSHCVTCPYCTTQDAHFVKPLVHCYTKQIIQSGIQLP